MDSCCHGPILLPRDRKLVAQHDRSLLFVKNNESRCLYDLCRYWRPGADNDYWTFSGTIVLHFTYIIINTIMLFSSYWSPSIIKDDVSVAALNVFLVRWLLAADPNILDFWPSSFCRIWMSFWLILGQSRVRLPIISITYLQMNFKPIQERS